jgi:hypothetical protein
MEDRAGAATASVRVDGAPAEATLGGGELRWRRATGGGRGAGKRALSLEREVLGVEARGDAVVVRAFVAAGASRATSCASGAGAGGRKGAGRRRRRDYVIEMPDGEGAAAAWCERMTRCLDSFGTCAFSAQARRKLLSPVSILIRNVICYFDIVYEMWGQCQNSKPCLFGRINERTVNHCPC